MKTALITGASRGIGRACAELFAENGYAIAVCCNESVAEAEDLCENLKKLGHTAHILRGDVSNSAEASALVHEAEMLMGKIDTVVTCAGISAFSLATETGDDDWDRLLSVNLSGTFYVIRAALKGMISRISGSIVTVSSIWGVYGASCESAYSASKAGVIGLTQALAKEVGPSGVRVNCVAPGFIDTDMNSGVSAEACAEFFERTALLRGGSAREAAKAIYFLASEDSSYITGQTLRVDGGYLF